MKPTFCSLAATAAVLTSLIAPKAVATLGAEPPAWGGEPAASAAAADANLVLDLLLLPGRMEVALRDRADRPLSSEDATGKALLTVNGREMGVALVPSGGNRMVGLAPFREGDAVSAAVTVSLDGRIATARYGML